MHAAVEKTHDPQRCGVCKKAQIDMKLMQLIMEKAVGINHGEIVIKFVAGRPKHIIRTESELV